MTDVLKAQNAWSSVLRAIASRVLWLALIPIAGFYFSLLGNWAFFAEMLVNFRAQMLASLLPFLALACVLRHRLWGLCLGIPVFFCLWDLSPAWWPESQPPAGPTTVRLMTFNVLGPNSNVDAVLAEIKLEKPDILVVVELNDRWAKAMERLDPELRPAVVVPRLFGNGIAVYSRLPVVSADVHRLAAEITDCPAADVVVDVRGQQLRVIGVHFISPVYVHTSSLAMTLQQSRMKLDLRNQEMRDASAIVADPWMPTVMAGDFNCTPFSGSFRDLIRRTGLRDTRRGRGYQATFPAHTWLAQIPIDHVLVASQIHVSRRRTGNASGSDHLPVICDFSIAGPASK